MSNSEKGHYKNITAFTEMIARVESFGADYNPSNPLLKLVNLKEKLTASEQDYKAVSVTTAAFNLAVGERSLIYKPLKPLTTQSLASFVSNSEASKEQIKDIRTIKKKLDGVRAAPKSKMTDKPDEPAPKSISVSQQSYDMRYDNFLKFIDALSLEPSYKPNEPELKLSGLKDYAAQLNNSNSKVIQTFEAVNLSRIQRDKTLYQEKTGLYDIQAAVKLYAKSLFKTNSIQYKQLVAIKFKKPAKLFI